MSWHLPRRLTPIYHAVSITLLYSVSSAVLPSVAQAVNFGKTTIISLQDKPLVASIKVAGISAANFSVGLASESVYQKMGLTPTPSMTVRFVASSANAGQIHISTTQPVTLPFADMVLTVNNKGQSNLVPKTLLLPLSNNVFMQSADNLIDNSADSLSNNSVDIAQDSHTPILNALNTQPLMVTRGTPPPLFTAAETQVPLQVKILKNESSLPAMAVHTMPHTVPTVPTEKDTNVINALNTVNTERLTAQNTKRQTSLSSAITTDNRLDVLKIQETRRITAANRGVMSDNIDQLGILVEATTETSQPYELAARLTQIHNQ